MRQIDDSSIDLIYCDILYGTGRKFDDFQDLKPQKDVIEKFYIPRIEEMHRVLKDTGSIYLHMDSRIVHWVRLIMDDIFGYDNFKNEIIWHYTSGGTPKDRYKKNHDNILFYTKGCEPVFNIQKQPASNPRRYNKTDVYGERYMINYGKKYYLKAGNNADDVWSYLLQKEFGILNSQAKERVGYDTQKPKALLERIIEASSNKGNIVADFFCGSGTTGVVTKELGRQYIMCDINPRAIEISKERLSEI